MGPVGRQGGIGRGGVGVFVEGRLQDVQQPFYFAEISYEETGYGGQEINGSPAARAE